MQENSLGVKYSQHLILLQRPQERLRWQAMSRGAAPVPGVPWAGKAQPRPTSYPWRLVQGASARHHRSCHCPLQSHKDLI